VGGGWLVVALGAATPGIDVDPVHGKDFVRFCYAGSVAEMHEAVERIGRWLNSDG
jgi:aspartate/methionine/tyrosine aminotransferase